MDALTEIAATLKTIGLNLNHEADPIEDEYDLAARVQVAALNFARGKRRSRGEVFDDDLSGGEQAASRQLRMSFGRPHQPTHTPPVSRIDWGPDGPTPVRTAPPLRPGTYRRL